MNKIDITKVELPTLSNYLGTDQPSYRIDQILEWIYKRNAADFEEMSNLPNNIREMLSARYYIPAVTVADEVVSAEDGTKKFLLRFFDGEFAESVYLPGESHDAVCISTQIGCKMKCDFCATATLGFTRNLSTYEILSQYVLACQERPDRPIRNVVLMGQGEPLDNFENSVEAIDLLRNFHDVGARRITLSTSGIPDGIRRLAEEKVGCKLAVSLNSARQGTREKLMPIAKKYDLRKLTSTLLHYYQAVKKRPTLEYILIKGVNDGIEDARALVNLSNRFPCKINIIIFNGWSGCDYEPPDTATVEAFMTEAARSTMALTFRASRGNDIAAACGMLRQNRIAKEM